MHATSDEEREAGGRRRFGPQDLWKVLLGLLGLMAVVQELRTPEEERTWHGTVARFVPYDFRRPTVQRITQTYWDPEGSVITGKVFGVGWTLNAGAVARRIQQR